MHLASTPRNFVNRYTKFVVREHSEARQIIRSIIRTRAVAVEVENDGSSLMHQSSIVMKRSIIRFLRLQSLLFTGKQSTVVANGSFSCSRKQACRIFGVNNHENNRSFRQGSSTLLNTFGDNAAEAGSDANILQQLPFREYGYRSTPFSWDELHQIIVTEQNLAKLCRSVQQEQEYQKSLHRIKKEWKSVKDYILHSKFHLPFEVDNCSSSSRSIPTKAHVTEETLHESTSKTAEPILRIVPNDFPYFCAPGIHHWVLWKLGSVSITKEEIEDAKTVVQNEWAAHDIIHWENPPALKSLPEIHHVHFLFRQKG